MDNRKLSTMTYAVGYLEMLRKGLHPNTGNVLFDKDDKENAGIVNCLNFVCDFLNEYVKEEQTKERPFELTELARISIPISAENVIISRFTQTINQYAKEPDMQRLRTRQVTGWLLKNGYLQTKTIAGKPVRVPTEKGNSVGITTNEVIGNDAEYIVNLYNSDAQRFILDNIEKIISDIK